jgi:hypothetical protein
MSSVSNVVAPESSAASTTIASQNANPCRSCRRLADTISWAVVSTTGQPA